VSLGSGFVGERVDVGDMENEIAFTKATRKKLQVAPPPLSPSLRSEAQVDIM